MAKNFYDCAKNGGKVVNKKTEDGKVIKMCYDKEGGKHIKHNNKKRRKKKQVRFVQATENSLQTLAKHFNTNRQ